MTSPSRCGLRHLVCHFSNDGGVKRRGGEEMGDLKRREGGRRKEKEEGEGGGGRGDVFIV